MAALVSPRKAMILSVPKLQAELTDPLADGIKSLVVIAYLSVTQIRPDR